MGVMVNFAAKFAGDFRFARFHGRQSGGIWYCINRQIISSNKMKQTILITTCRQGIVPPPN